MRAEIVLTGTELLLGEIVDTNSTMIAKMLREIGLNLHYKTTVGDNEDRITEVLRHALGRVDFVIVSGGLGPTVDDVTRQAAARATDRKLVYSPELEAQIAERFRAFGKAMSENNKRQAWIPEGAIPVENPVGTAPCFIVEAEAGTIICLPGVPRELKYQMENAIIPYLKEKCGPAQIIKARILHTAGLGESSIDSQIDDLMRLNNPTVGLAAHLGQVDVRITAKANTEAEASALIAPVEAELRKRLGSGIFGVDEESLPELVSKLLAQKNLRLSLLDACTNGLLAQTFNSSDISIIDLEQIASSSADFSKVDSENANELASAEELARQLSNNDTLGVCLLAAKTTHSNDYASIIALAHKGQTKTRSFHYPYRGETGQQWLAVQTLNQIRRWLEKEIG